VSTWLPKSSAVLIAGATISSKTASPQITASKNTSVTPAGVRVLKTPLPTATPTSARRRFCALIQERSSLRGLKRTFGVSPSTLIGWLKKLVAAALDLMRPPARRRDFSRREVDQHPASAAFPVCAQGALLLQVAPDAPLLSEAVHLPLQPGAMEHHSRVKHYPTIVFGRVLGHRSGVSRAYRRSAGG
jgi:hypothetical protein